MRLTLLPALLLAFSSVPYLLAAPDATLEERLKASAAAALDTDAEYVVGGNCVSDDQCSFISSCSRDNALSQGTCALTWWFVLLVLVLICFLLSCLCSCICLPCCCCIECVDSICCC